MVSVKKIFKVFYIDKQGALPPGGHVFWWIKTAWTLLLEGYQRNISVKLYWNRSIRVSYEKIFKVFYIDIYRGNKPHPIVAMFFDKS